MQKFAQIISSYNGRGGFKLQFSVEKPGKNWGGKNSWALKVDLFFVTDIYQYVHKMKNSLVLIPSTYTSLQNQLSTICPYLNAQKDRKIMICKF